MRKIFRNRDGYIALVSILIIMGFVSIVTISIAVTSFLARGTASTSYYRSIAHSLAESCVQKALLGLAATSTYPGNETLTVATSSLGSDTCTIFAVTASSTQKVIRTQGKFKETVSNIQAVVNGTDLSLVSWEEPVSF